MSIGAFFFANGATFASWVPRLPELRHTLGLSDTTLGVTLVGSGIGGLVMAASSGRIIDRAGSRLTTIGTSAALAASLPLIALAPSGGVMFAVLLLIGAFDGLTDVAMNSQALQLQRRVSRSIVNRMHATWSIGTLVGGLAAGLSAAAGVSLRVQLSVTAVFLLATAVAAAPALLPSEPARDIEYTDDGRRVRPGRLLLAGMFGVGLLAVMVELPATEWASLLMAERFGLTVGAAALGFVGFTAGMVLGRLSGDLLVDRFDAERFRRSSAAVAAAGLVVACTGAAPWVTVVGLFVAGAGGAAMFPMSVRRAGDLVPGATGVAMFSGGARLGILIGPPLMGLLSDLTDRSVALLLVGGTAAVASAVLRLPDAPPRRGPVPDEGLVPHH